MCFVHGHVRVCTNVRARMFTGPHPAAWRRARTGLKVVQFTLLVVFVLITDYTCTLIFWCFAHTRAGCKDISYRQRYTHPLK